MRYFESPQYLWLVTELCHGEESFAKRVAILGAQCLTWQNQELCERIISEQRGLPETEVRARAGPCCVQA